MAQDKQLLKLVVVDDHDLLREGITARLSDVPFVDIVAQGRNGLEAIELCKTHNPDLLLLDISMPVMNGLEAATQILKDMPDMRILFLSIYNDNEYVQEALRIGAGGFLLKDVSKEEMLNAIRFVARGETYLGPKIAAALSQAILKRQRAQHSYDLTQREMQILGLIAEGHLNKEVAYRLGISIRTVESHRSSIREKVGGGNAAALAKVAKELGL